MELISLRCSFSSKSRMTEILRSIYPHKKKPQIHSTMYSQRSFYVNWVPGQLMDGLRDNDLDRYSHLLTGYAGSASFLKTIARLVNDLKKKNPGLIYGAEEFPFRWKKFISIFLFLISFLSNNLSHQFNSLRSRYGRQREDVRAKGASWDL